jgi:hypothetical protein
MAPPETEPEMDWNVRRDARALLRIAALLLALANLAERAALLSFAPRTVVLAILRHAEAVVWAFALGASCAPAASRQVGCEQWNVVSEGAVHDDGAADAARLAISLRMLALMIAGWSNRLLSTPDALLSLMCRVLPERPGSGGRWRGPAALPAPDSS